ncbi:MAG: hypothetical protein J6K95_04760 [Rikenellaceae bacterium]|nr:hypothetical protein [Rikenellaceae bacterium]
MDNDNGRREKLMENLALKANLQQRIFDNTFAVFNEFKEALLEFSSELNEELDDRLDKRVRIEYRDKGKFEAQLQTAGDVLIFSMHTNVFSFPEGHPVWESEYLAADRNNAYCGVINIYDFLADSFKYNRNEDLGYLVGRIFINREMQYFVEGEAPEELRYPQFGSRQITKEAILNIIESSVDYCQRFDLWIPPYESAREVAVEQMNTKFENSKIQTGKRLGYPSAEWK